MLWLLTLEAPNDAMMINAGCYRSLISFSTTLYPGGNFIKSKEWYLMTFMTILTIEHNMFE